MKGYKMSQGNQESVKQNQSENLMKIAVRGYDLSIWEWDIVNHTCHQSLHLSRCDTDDADDYENFPQYLFDIHHYHSDSIELAWSVFRRILDGEKRVEETLHTYDSRTDEYWWENVCYTTIFNDKGEPVRAVAVSKDVTRQKELEQELLRSELRYEAAVRGSGIHIWEYDIETDTITMYTSSARVKTDCQVLHNYVQSTLDQGHIREDSVEDYLEMFRRVQQGEEAVAADIWYKTDDEFGFWCERISYTMVYDEIGRPVKAFGSGRDVTREKNAEKQYQEELAYREAIQNTTITSTHINLTQNTIVDGRSILPEIHAKILHAKNANEYLESIWSGCISDRVKKEYAKKLNREALMRIFGENQTSLSIEIAREMEGDYYWTTLQIHMLKKPYNDDIIAFLYSKNVTNEKVMQLIMQEITQTNYDFLVVVDGIRDTALSYSSYNPEKRYKKQSFEFDKDTQEYVKQFVCVEDQSRVLQDVKLSNILARLEESPVFQTFYSAYEDDRKTIRKKQLRFHYLKPEYGVFLMTRMDMTDAVEEEGRKNRTLEAALESAEQANNSKSEFMSRMSHEIRTPMNAITGMTEIALQSLEDKELVKDCLEKSQHASRYLMLLINDILDMSKIEQGKIVLQEKVIDREILIDNIYTIIKTQADIAGVKFVIKGFEQWKSRYVGDCVRLQQILINILANAVKFTPVGGMVEWRLSGIREAGNYEILNFVIRDTGIGISKEFIGDIFQPFSQEHSGTNSQYGGNGLGLAISKNLAIMMNGDITVESEPGKGTTFTIETSLGRSDLDERSVIEQKNTQKNLNYDFSGRRILLVEDHELNIMVATKLLKNRGAEIEVAMNGRQGVAKFQDSVPGYYDAIFMDIRMPVMNGLEASRAIRQLERADAKRIPIIAMTANAFEGDARKSREAGMDEHLAKPIDPVRLYETLQGMLAVPAEN